MVTDPELPAPASSTQPVTGIDVLGAGLEAVEPKEAYLPNCLPL